MQSLSYTETNYHNEKSVFSVNWFHSWFLPPYFHLYAQKVSKA